MDSFHADTVKLEKAKAIVNYRQLQKITNLFRVIEICVIFIMISNFSPQLTVAIKSSREYFKYLSILLSSPRFVFMIGNAIIITLFVKSGHLSAKDSAIKSGGINIDEEFVEKSERINEYGFEKQRKKQSICEEKTVMVVVDTYSTATTTAADAVSDMKIYRSKSEKLKNENCKKGRRVLRRTMTTESCRESMDSGEKVVKHSYSEDNLSNEEFKRAVEAFIARQQRFLREEEEEEEEYAALCNSYF